MPERIQLRRVKGWRLPENAVSVARPTKWGNPFRLGTCDALARIPAIHHEGMAWEYESRISAAGMRHDYHHRGGQVTEVHVRSMTAEEAVQCYRAYVTDGGWPLDGWRAPADGAVEVIRRELGGKDLACWCQLEDASGNRVPCHADILLELANPAVTE